MARGGDGALIKRSVIWTLFGLYFSGFIASVHASEHPLRFLPEALSSMRESSDVEENIAERLDLSKEQREDDRSSSSGTSLPENVAEMEPKCSSKSRRGTTYEYTGLDVERTNPDVDSAEFCCNSCQRSCRCYAWIYNGNTCIWLRGDQYPTVNVEGRNRMSRSSGIKSNDDGCDL